MFRFSLPLVILATPALAQEDFARDLATVLAAEEPCGLSFNESAIANLIAERADPADLGFATELQTYSTIAEYSVGEMNGATKIAHCAAVTQTARHYGFIE